MAVLRKIFGTSIALAVALTVSAPYSAFAQAGAPAGPAQGGRGAGAGGGGRAGGRGGRGGGAALYTPAAGAKDLKSVLFNWAWYMGMLRSSEERDLIMSLEYQGKGTVQVDGQPCNATKYRTSISYQTSGERIQYTGTRPNGQACSNVEVLSGAYAWNEDIPGAELVPGKGKATPMPATVEERVIRLWASPQGAFKAAMAGTSDPPEMAPRPQLVPADVAMAGKTSVAWVGGKPVVTFPIPGVPNAIASATLDAKFMPERVVVKQGAKTYEFTYSNYKDWNNPLNPAEAFYAGRMIENNGTVLRDITTTVTEVAQMYVVMPVPASIKAAIKPTNQPPNWTLNVTTPARPAATQTAAVVTPRLADGPDMTENKWPPRCHCRWWEPPVWSNADARWGNQPRRRLQKPQWTTSGWISSGSRPRGLGRVVPITNPNFGTRFRNSISGPTSTIRHDLSAAGESAAGHPDAHYPDRD